MGFLQNADPEEKRLKSYKNDLILTFFILILLMLKSKMRLESLDGGEMLLEARGDFGEGEGVGDLEARLRLEHRGDNIEAKNEGDLGLNIELDMEIDSVRYSGSLYSHHTCPCQWWNNYGAL